MKPGSPTVAKLPEGWFTSYLDGHIRVITAPGIGHVTINYEHRRIVLGYRMPTPWVPHDKDLGVGQTRKLEEKAIALLAEQPRIQK